MMAIKDQDILSHDTLQEYCSRLGLREFRGNTELALERAESKYRELTGRDVTLREARIMTNLMEEIDRMQKLTEEQDQDTISAAV